MSLVLGTNKEEKQGKGDGEKTKGKSQGGCVTVKPKNYILKFCLLHMHAQTSEGTMVLDL